MKSGPTSDPFRRRNITGQTLPMLKGLTER